MLTSRSTLYVYLTSIKEESAQHGAESIEKRTRNIPLSAEFSKCFDLEKSNDLPSNIKEIGHYHSAVLMVWMSIILHCPTYFHFLKSGTETGVRFREFSLEPFQKYCQLLLHFNERNAPPYGAHLIDDFLEYVDNRWIPWTARSAEINPREYR